MAFHTSALHRNASLFLSGCFDRKLRLWSLETGRVVAWQAAPAMVTCAAFSPDGRLIVAGLFSGLCLVLAADGLQLLRTLDCRNRRGPFRHGRKVTGLDFTPGGSHALVTTNDSRVRMVDLLSGQTVVKYAGLRNADMQIRASFDASALRVASGSEDGRVLVWRTQNDLYVPALNPRLTGFDEARVRSFESFVADEGAQDAAVGAALRAEELLEDPRDTEAEAFRRRCEEDCRDGHTMVWRDERGLVFRASVSARTVDAAQISGVYTPPGLRNRGIATRALAEMCLRLLERSGECCLFVNAVNTPAIAVYRRLGFVERSPWASAMPAGGASEERAKPWMA